MLQKAEDRRKATARKSKQTLPDDPLWYRDAIIYQLHIKSFFDANGDGIGDFAGLNEKLDYIASLGVNAVWLLPFYPSPRKDDGYDIAEYRDVHPDYGTLADLRHFVRAAHERGLRVITELVINHTSDQHPWFQRARRAKPGSNARDFYVWSDTDQRYLDTRIIFVDTEKSNWTWDPVANAYFWHRFYSHQPDLNFDNPQVLKAVLGVMRFWLDIGVDGLRLDAIPYLVEREGTNNENLPETHAVLKKIRATLDAEYKNRMLLAEANQWPEDTQEYFGQGDECHMAFHFPLMPRMYMAIAREDRFPVTDIMKQTPDIPDGCQWAIFLRNHDELTLEMVTDAERDYLWKFYAADRRARINLGIRRRLAPLLERDRRRIELMNGLLLSMPGTPVLYYGDEIGMGDNIYLGDRDGVRTPMQWSADRNGGFSRADPVRMVLPPIMGPLYGYDSVNVEAQAGDPHSLLNWMRRMLFLRRNHQAFGRGSLRFLYPTNRRVLAYLREYEGERILCVANLSRMPQAVELDLSAFDGMVPVEMTGPSAFPPIGRLTYLLTLPPYGFYWFELKADTDAPSWRQAPPEQMPDLTTLVLRRDVREILSGETAKLLDRDILPAYLSRRRWFAAKNEAIENTKIAYAEPLPGAADVLIGETEVRVGGRTERYLLPLGIVWDEQTPSPLPQQLALARVRRGRKVGYLTDAFAVEPFARAVLDGLKNRLAIETPDGTVRFEPTPAFETIKDYASAGINWLSAEQSNSSLLVEQIAMVKLVRRVSGGIHPEAEMTRHLTAIGYDHTAALLGEVVRTASDGTPHTLMIIQGVIRNQGDAWTWVLDNLRRTLEEAVLAGEADHEHDGVFASLEAFFRKLGKRLGELHAALALPSEDPDFAPEEADAGTVERWGNAVRAQVEAALDALSANRDAIDANCHGLIDMVEGKRQALLARIGKLAEAGRGAALTRVHGDFHLGQVLVAQGDAYIIDFEGEPARPLAERRRKETPLKDVAGLLRSIDYAAASFTGAAPTTDSNEPATHLGQAERQKALLAHFRERAAARFLRGYEAGGGTHPARGPLLDLMLLEKAAYEIGYEAANRPKWLPVPLRGLVTLVERITGPERQTR